jgi:hypothetical protein
VDAEKAMEDAEKEVAEPQGKSIHCWLWPTLAAVLLVGALVAFFALRSPEEEDDDDDSDDDDSSEDDEAGKP